MAAQTKRAQSARARKDQSSVPSPQRKDKNDAFPAYAQPPFHKQITRNQAIMGKLLEDNTLVRVLRGAETSVDVYDTNFEFQSHNRNNLGHVRQFATVIGRTEFSKSGTRAAAAGTKPSNWRPLAPPNDSLVRPASASSGPSFERQITRQQDVNGKLLEDNSMTRFLFGQATHTLGWGWGRLR